MAGLHDIRDCSTAAARGAVSQQGIGASVGDATAHAWGVSVTDPGVAVGGAVKAQRVRIDTFVLVVSTNNASCLLDAGGSSTSADSVHDGS